MKPFRLLSAHWKTPPVIWFDCGSDLTTSKHAWIESVHWNAKGGWLREARLWQVAVSYTPKDWSKLWWRKPKRSLNVKKIKNNAQTLPIGLSSMTPRKTQFQTKNGPMLIICLRRIFLLSMKNVLLFFNCWSVMTKMIKFQVLMVQCSSLSSFFFYVNRTEWILEIQSPRHADHRFAAQNRNNTAFPRCNRISQNKWYAIYSRRSTYLYMFPGVIFFISSCILCDTSTECGLEFF